LPVNDADTLPIEVVCPKEWERWVAGWARFIREVFRLGAERFRLHSPQRLTLRVIPAQAVHMEADWEQLYIEVHVPMRPSVSVWVFSIYFGLAHEVGHLLWHRGPLTLREAWAHYFALAMLKVYLCQPRPKRQVSTVLLYKDFWFSLSILRFMRYARNPIECAIARIVHAWQKAAQEQVMLFLQAIPKSEYLEHSVLTQQFSEYFGVSETVCRSWFREE
jgi:hypothetical protein